MTISIWGRLEGKRPEVVDRASSKHEANYLACEYQMAYGRQWKVWAGRLDEEPRDVAQRTY